MAKTMNEKVVCVTGGAKRIGASIIQHFHQQGYRVIIHYHHSQSEAKKLTEFYNFKRPNSACCIQGNLEKITDLEKISQQILSSFGQIDVLIHNASRFYPTTLGKINFTDWDNLFSSNAIAPLFLTQYLFPYLQATQGNIISLLDIHANARPFKGYTVYNMAKAAHQMMVQSLALELAPTVRVNGIAPGVNILPEMASEQALTETQITQICTSIPLQKIGKPDDIATAALYLANAPYVTGQILVVDGGRSLTLAGSD